MRFTDSKGALQSFGPALLVALATSSGLASAQVELGARIVVFGPKENDPRLELVAEAAAFWNSTFRELGLEPVFEEPRLEVGSPLSRPLENYARSIWQRAGRPPGPAQPTPPAAFSEIEGEVVVLLSSQQLMPFSWPVPPGEQRYFIAIDEDRSSELDPNAARNVVAHELGHAVGLEHHRDSATMMCLPCESSNLSRDEPTFLPLTELDRQRLLEIYSVVE